MEPLESYSTTMKGASHWSLEVRKGTSMRLSDIYGGANVGMLFYNPKNLLERFNAPDTLKCQHTFKLTQGNCLYSDMGRIFASIIEDTLGWHETVCGNSNAQMVEQKWGKRDYQTTRNLWNQNGHDAFLTELAKYGLGEADMAANINWFSKVSVDDAGVMQYQPTHSPAGSEVTLRFEMDTLVIMHTCPHPLNESETYPRNPVKIELSKSAPVEANDLCLNHCEENKRGFKNNALYLL
ncbi:urea amidolyase associated protein UAAP1 [Aestuariibacter sp. A3R04]|uniref:urea amidolyase associated protein UAAP1 n=1 Tax=Aestuariibacter sp. A3R04 TaxID=2841571 RepID=UPI001C0A193B|nr:urea amidolyase associated protein UAAP1 [Aestuariibacter sp. A3R04]MBU3021601.1 urea carboxylase-associated family protein [Aestuariibacter sp. A3R04]